MRIEEWGLSCILLFLALAGCGLLLRRGWPVLFGAALLASSDFVRGAVYRGGGLEVPSWWGSWSASWPEVVAWGLALGYCSWALYPFVLVASGAGLRTFAAVSVAVVVGGLMAAVWPVEPPWMAGAARAVDSIPMLANAVAGDVSPAAAYPSVHVAVPAVVALSEKSGAWAWYAVVTAAVVVLAGEHWVLDVVGGLCLALAVVGAFGIVGTLVKNESVGGAFRALGFTG